MTWSLREAGDLWEIWNDDEKIEERSIPYLSQSSAVPFFSTQTELDGWLNSEAKKRGKNYLLRLLSGRNYPSQVLRRKLVLKSIPKAVIQELIDWVERIGIVQDSEYIRSMIERECQSSHSRALIIWKLRSKGFSEKDFAPLVAEIATVERERESIRKILPKLKGKSKPQMIAALIRRGFSMSVIAQELGY